MKSLNILDMFPIFTSNDVTDTTPSNLIYPSEILLTSSFGVKISDLKNLFSCEFRKTLIGFDLTSINSIGDVVLNCTELKMLWVDALEVITFMSEDLISRNQTVDLFPRKSVGSNYTSFGYTESKLSISISVESCSPFPARCCEYQLPIFINFVPKSFHGGVIPSNEQMVSN